MRRTTLLLVCMALIVVAAAGVAYAKIIVGTNEADTLIGTPNHDEISGRGGGDLIKAKGANDEARGNAGRDEIFGGAGNDDIVAGGGADLSGDPADPIPPPAVFGGAGNDFIDTVDGVAGNDSSDGGSDDDTCRLDLDDVDNDGVRDVVPIREKVDAFNSCEHQIFVDTNETP